MSSVWDDPDTESEEVTPLPQGAETVPDLGIPPEKLETLAIEVFERVAREVIPEIAEKAVREIVPAIAERLVKEQLDVLMKESEGNE